MDAANHLTPSAVQDQLARLRRSAIFASSDRLMTFLQFVVDQTLNGASATLKEAVIGNAVYGREPCYDSRIDSTVRVEARRLRRKLDEYYAGSGRGDPIRISLPTGGYVPLFNTIDAEAARPGPNPNDGSSEKGIFERGDGAALAVMPFRALSNDYTVESFADGLTDEVIYAVGRADGLRVISRGTAFLFKDQRNAFPGVAAELGVNAILQGTVRNEGDTLRVTVEVSDPAGFILWADRFDSSDDDLLSLQEKIAATILSRMRFDSSRMRSMQAKPGRGALEAYASVHKARQLQDLQTPGALQEALRIFNAVAKSAPDYARGHTGVADCHCDLYRLGLMSHDVALDATKAATARALQIDSDSVEAHAALATISAWFHRDRSAAESLFRRSRELGENARAARVYGVFLTFLERHEEAQTRLREARQAEPFSVQQDIAESISHYQSRHYQPLLDGHAISSSPHVSGEVLFYRALAQVFAGEAGQAEALLESIQRATDRFPDLWFAGAELDAWLNRPERARQLLLEPPQGSSCFARATLAAAVGDQARCLAALSAAVEKRELSAVWIRTDPRFDSIRDSGKFQALLQGLSAPTPLEIAS
jgi:TolB-like protein/Tfp pilus assembly protein PilF